jgi:cytochrome b6-f complex iron-sulfur subunit
VTLSRRDFLRLSALGAATAGGGLAGCVPDLSPAPYVDVAAPVSGRLTVALADVAPLADVGGAAILRAPSLDPAVLVVRTGAATFGATGARCTHQGCPVGFDGSEIVCPCHLSRFGLDGTVLHPPARAGLPSYPVSFDAMAGTFTVDLRAGDPGFPAAVGGEVRLTFAQFPALATPGGSVVGRPVGYGRPIVVVALPGGGYAADDAVCTHLGCTVGYDAGADVLACPCHGSTFTTGGAVVHGPATRALLALAVAPDADGVTVTVPEPPA